MTTTVPIAPSSGMTAGAGSGQYGGTPFGYHQTTQPPQYGAPSQPQYYSAPAGQSQAGIAGAPAATAMPVTYTNQQRASTVQCVYKVLEIIFAILLPPLGVLIVIVEKRKYDGVACADFIINILLTVLGWIPGIIHAFYVIFKYESNVPEGGSTASTGSTTLTRITTTTTMPAATAAPPPATGIRY